MFGWGRDKTTTSYSNIPDDRSSNISNNRPQTTPSATTQKQYPNGREIYFVFYELDQNMFV